MKKSYKVVLAIVIILLLFIFGIFLGIYIQSEEPIEIDRKIRYSEILNWLTTIFIGVLVGYFFKNNHENNKVIKTYLLNDLQEILSQGGTVKEYCFNLKKSTKLTDEERREIISKVNVLDKKIKIFSDLLKDCYTEKYESINGKLINALNSYNRILTCDKTYDDPISPSYFDDIVSESSKFESVVRKILFQVVHKI